MSLPVSSRVLIIGVMRYQKKRYSRNNRVLWCSKEANVEGVEVSLASGQLSCMDGPDLRLVGAWAVLVGFS